MQKYNAQLANETFFDLNVKALAERFVK